MPSKWKRFGSTILNVDRVERVDRVGERTDVYLAAPAPPAAQLMPLRGQKRGKAQAERELPLTMARQFEQPAAHRFSGDVGKKIWDYFDDLASG